MTRESQLARNFAFFQGAGSSNLEHAPLIFSELLFWKLNIYDYLAVTKNIVKKLAYFGVHHNVLKCVQNPHLHLASVLPYFEKKRSFFFPF